MQYDIIIIGGASAGLTAAIYSARRALKTLVISKDVGGQAAYATAIENYPGFESISGPELLMKFKAQAEKAGAEFNLAEVTKVEKKEDSFNVITSIGEFSSKTLILSFGLEHRRLNIPGEKELTGRGVTYCATCDGPLFKGKIVGVVGGGNSAFDAAEFLSRICTKVYLFVRTDQYKAEQVLIDKVKAAANVEIMNFTEVKELSGQNKLEKAVVFNVQTKEEKTVELNGLFIEVGYVPQTDLVKDIVEIDAKGQIVVDRASRTKVPGIFAAGDVTDAEFKQIVISAGEGAKAALSANRYIKNLTGKEDVPDWK
jgi:thioredoxin-disulfide reductase